MKFNQTRFDTYEEMGAYLKKKFEKGKLDKEFYAYHDNGGLATGYYLFLTPTSADWDHEWYFKLEDPGSTYPYMRLHRTSRRASWDRVTDTLWMVPHTWVMEKYNEPTS